MATSVSEMSLSSRLQVIEDLGRSTTVDDKITLDNNDDIILTGSSSPDATVVYKGTVTLTAGAATLDLTALTDSSGATIATTGLKVRAIKVKPTGTNANAITLSEGASNGYELFGDGWKVAVQATSHFLAYLGATAPDVATGAKTIDFAGTLVQSCDVMIVFG